MKNGAHQGNRNDSAARLIGHLFGKGNDEGVVWELINQWNVGKNKPPIDHTELRNTFESIRDLNRKNDKKDKEKKDIDVAQFLDTEKKVTAEYDEQYVRIPFAGSLLSIIGIENERWIDRWSNLRSRRYPFIRQDGAD